MPLGQAGAHTHPPKSMVYAPIMCLCDGFLLDLVMPLRAAFTFLLTGFRSYGLLILFPLLSVMDIYN